MYQVLNYPDSKVSQFFGVMPQLVSASFSSQKGFGSQMYSLVPGLDCLSQFLQYFDLSNLTMLNLKIKSFFSYLFCLNWWNLHIFFLFLTAVKILQVLSCCTFQTGVFETVTPSSIPGWGLNAFPIHRHLSNEHTNFNVIYFSLVVSIKNTCLKRVKITNTMSSEYVIWFFGQHIHNKRLTNWFMTTTLACGSRWETYSSW